MSKRPLSLKQRTWLLEEFSAWQAAELLSREQSTRILDLYESAQESSNRRGAWAVFTLMSLALLLVGAAILLLVGFNWAEFPAPLKLTLLFGGMLGSYAVGFWMRFRRRLGMLSEIPFFLGCLLYGVTIWQIAQIFQIQSHYPTGIWIWALGVLPFAMCLDSVLLHVLYAVLLAIWVGTEVLDYGRLGFWLFGIRRWDILPNAAYTLPLLALPGVLWAYRKQSGHAVALYALLLAWWVVLQPVAWGHSPVVVYAIGAAGALMLMVAQSHRAQSPLAIPYRIYGTLIAAGVLVPLSFASFNYELLHTIRPASGLPAAAILGVAGLATALLTAWVRSVVDPQWGREVETLGAGLRRLGVPLAILALMIGLCLWGWAFGMSGQYLNYMQRPAWMLTPEVLVPTLLCNAALLVFCVWLLRLGLTEDRGRPFAAGVLLFLLWVVLRYVDLFGEIGGMLGGALLFLLCGVALYIVARFWQSRLARGKEVLHD